MTMKTQTEHDRDATAIYVRATAPKPETGVACDKCGTELHYTDQLLRMSSPPKRQVWCSGCEAVSFIVA